MKQDLFDSTHVSSPWPPCSKTQKKERLGQTKLILSHLTIKVFHKEFTLKIGKISSFLSNKIRKKETNASRLSFLSFFHFEASSSKSFKKTNLSRILLLDIWDFLKRNLFFTPFHLLWHILQNYFQRYTYLDCNTHYSNSPYIVEESIFGAFMSQNLDFWQDKTPKTIY